MKTTILVLKREDSALLVRELNILLANFQVYYQNLRGLHWNIKGRNFFELHLKFEELYTDAQDKIDMIAERILTLQGRPIHTFEDYSKVATISTAKNIERDEEAVQVVVSSLIELLRIEKSLLILSDEAGDEGTNSMMSDFISEQEKIIWMMNAWLS